MKTEAKPYRSSPQHIAREMIKVGDEGARFGWDDETILLAMIRMRLYLDISDMLTGPTSGAEANRLAYMLLQSADPTEVARWMVEAGQRYLTGQSNRTRTRE